MLFNLNLLNLLVIIRYALLGLIILRSVRNRDYLLLFEILTEILLALLATNYLK